MSMTETEGKHKRIGVIAVIKSFFKIGLIGFGGGSALIPVIEKEVCEDNHYIERDIYSNYTVICNITPGALPVKLGALVGYDMAGKRGMLLAALFTSVPGVFITLAFLALLDVLGSGAIHVIEQAAIGISVFIIFLLVSYISKIMKDSKQASFSMPAVVLMLATLFLTFGKEIRVAISRIGIETALVDTMPIFDISTINVLALLFFLVFFTGGQLKGLRFYIACALTVIYVLMFGSIGIIDLGVGNTIFQIGLLVLGIAMLILDSRRDAAGKTKVKLDWIGSTKKSAPFIIITAVLFVACFVINSDNQLFFLSNGIISTATSFGGGEAYLTVADGIFVESGVISTTAFYSQILPIANALPGSILVKILSAIGFVIGAEISIPFAFLMGILGLMIATAASCVVCIFVAEIYTSFSYLSIFKVLKLWVLPVICGLLLTTILSMLNEVFHIANANDMGLAAMFALIIGIYAMVHTLHKKFHLNDVFLIILSAALSIIVVMFA